MGRLKSSANKLGVQKCEEICYSKENAYLDSEDRGNKGVFGKNVRLAKSWLRQLSKNLQI